MRNSARTREEIEGRNRKNDGLHKIEKVNGRGKDGRKYESKRDRGAA